MKKSKNQPLPSVDISKNDLAHVLEVIAKYPNFQKEGVVGKLAVKLARKAFFGDAVFVCCMVMGCRQYPGLPTAELYELKKTIFSLFLTYWSNPVGFESHIWSQCINSVGQLCKQLRTEAMQTATVTDLTIVS